MATQVISFANGGAATFVFDKPSTTTIAASPSSVVDKFATFGTPSIIVVSSMVASHKTSDSASLTPTTSMPSSSSSSSQPATTTAATVIRTKWADINQHQVDPSSILQSGYIQTAVPIVNGSVTSWATLAIGYYTSSGVLQMTTITEDGLHSTPMPMPTSTSVPLVMTSTGSNGVVYVSSITNTNNSSGIGYGYGPVASYTTGGDYNSTSGGIVDKNNDSDTPPSATIGGIIGALLAVTVAALFGGIWYWRKRRRERREEGGILDSNRLTGSGSGRGSEKLVRSAMSSSATVGSRSSSSSRPPRSAFLSHLDTVVEIPTSGTLSSTLTTPSSATASSPTSPLGRETVVHFGPNVAEPQPQLQSQSQSQSQSHSHSQPLLAPRLHLPSHLRHHVTDGGRLATKTIETRPDEITPYQLPPRPAPPPLPPRHFLASSTTSAAMLPLIPSPLSAAVISRVHPGRPLDRRFSGGSRSITTINTLTTDDDVFAVDGSSLARTLTTESTDSRDTAGLRDRRSSTPVAWGTVDPFADGITGSSSMSHSNGGISSYVHHGNSSRQGQREPLSESNTYSSQGNTGDLSSFAQSTRSGTAPTTLEAVVTLHDNLDPFADINHPVSRPAFYRSSPSERSINTNTQTEASFAAGDDQRALPLGHVWQRSSISSATSVTSASSSFANAAYSSPMMQSTYIHRLIENGDDTSSIDSAEPPPAYTVMSQDHMMF